MKLRFRRKRKTIPSLFDAEYYLENNKDLLDKGQAPYDHYCQTGFKLGLDPHPFFSTRHYQNEYLSGDHSIEPIAHYLANPDAGFDPHPLFDSISYLSQVDDKPTHDTSPLEHFMQHNAANQASPCVFFDTTRYLERYPEVGPSGLSAVYHYLRFGKNQGRLKSVDANLIDDFLKRDSRRSYDFLIGDWQREVSFLATLLRMDLSKPTVILAAESADFEYTNLLKKISSCYETSYEANVVHIFGQESEATEQFAVLGPAIAPDGNPEHPYFEFGNQQIFDIADRIGAIGTVYLATDFGPCGEKLANMQTPMHVLSAENPSQAFQEAVQSLAPKIKTVVLPATAPTPLATTTSPDSKPTFVSSQFDFESANRKSAAAEKSDQQGKPLNFRAELGLQPDQALIVGAGRLCMADGFDRFVATALSFIENETSDAHFVWIGEVDDANLDVARDLLADINNSNCSEQFFICEKPELVDAAFESADTILLTARQSADHPNVVNAIEVARPIVWFGGHAAVESVLRNDANQAKDAAAAASALSQMLSSESIQAESIKANSTRREKVNSVNSLVHQLSDHLQMSQLRNAGDPSVFDGAGPVILPFLRSRERRRVIFASPTWQISGVNTFIETCVRELNKRDFEASILFTTSQPMSLDKSLMPDVPTKILSTRPDLMPKQRRQLLKSYLELMSPCVFVPNYDFISSAITPELPADIATLGVLHSDDPAHYVHGYRMGPYWDSIVSVSETIHQNLMELNPAFADRSSVIRYGIEHQNSSIPAFRKNSDKLKVVYTGRIVEEQKRIMDFCDVADRLADHADRFELTFIGDGTAMGQFRQRMTPHVQSKLVNIVGRAKPEEIPAYLRSNHVFSLTSEYEGLPLSLLEAMSTGLVPVVTDVTSGIGEILNHDQNALLSPIGNPQAMADNLLRLANDSTLFASLSRASRETFFDRKLTASDMGDQYAEILDRIFHKIQFADQADTQRESKLIYCPHIERMLNVA
jgi:glycosyltransferase involved in cell wall biosynthesis